MTENIYALMILFLLPLPLFVFADLLLRAVESGKLPKITRLALALIIFSLCGELIWSLHILYFKAYPMNMDFAWWMAQDLSLFLLAIAVLRERPAILKKVARHD